MSWRVNNKFRSDDTTFMFTSKKLRTCTLNVLTSLERSFIVETAIEQQQLSSKSLRFMSY